MTISTTNNEKYHNYTGNGSVDTFTVNKFKMLQNSDLTHTIQVWKTVIATGIATLLTETTDYTVSLDTTAPSNGTVTLTAGNLPSTHRISIIPSVPETQEVNLQNAAVIDVEDIEAALDKLTLIVQSNQEQLSRAIVFGEDTLERNTQLSNLTSDQVDTLITQLNTLATSDNSISDFSIDSLTAATLDPAADYIPFHDATDSTMKKGLLPTYRGDVLDVQYTNKADTATISIASATEWYDITGMSVSTTPDAVTDKVLVGGIVNIGMDANSQAVFIRCVRSDGKVIGDYYKAVNSKFSLNTGGQAGDRTKAINAIPFQALDEEVGIITALSYKLQVRYLQGSGEVYINRDYDDTDSTGHGRAHSQINLMRFSKSDNSSASYTGIYSTYSQKRVFSTSNTNVNDSTIPLSALGVYTPLSIIPQNSTAKILSLNTVVGNSGNNGWALKLFNNGTQHGTFTSASSRKTFNTGVYAGAYSNDANRVLNTLISPAGAQVNLDLYVESTSNLFASGTFYQDVYEAAASLDGKESGQSSMIALSINTTATGSPWKQVVSATNTSATVTSVASSTGHSLGVPVTITPTSASSILLLSGHVAYTYNDASDGNYNLFFRIQRDGSNILVGTTPSSRIACTSKHFIANPNGSIINMPIHLMIPASAATSTTITPQVLHANGSAKDIIVNRSNTDTDSTGYFRCTSELNVIEILPN